MGRTILDETLGSWRDVREGVIAEARNVPAGRWDWRPGPDSRTVEELVRHILEVGMMMTGELTRTESDFTRAPYPKLIAQYGRAAQRAKGRARLLALLRRQHREAERAFRQAGEIHMLQHMTNFDGSTGSRLAWLMHGAAHEYYHGGQLALYARLMGRVPALTQAIQGG